MHNTDRHETEKFNRLARQWWDPEGPMGLLHHINPLRLEYVQRFLDVRGKSVLDIGCGAGLFSEALARQGARVTAIDAGSEAIRVARQHAHEAGLEIDYREATAEMLAELSPAGFDVVTCMELLEHVPDPASVTEACSRLLTSGGHAFFSTINRTAKSWLLTKLGAEYLLRLLPAGTHDYARFIRPSELADWCEKFQLSVDDIRGMGYLPLLHKPFYTATPAVNYLLHARHD